MQRGNAMSPASAPQVEDRKLRAVAEIELVENYAEVIPHRTFGQVHLFRDFMV